MVIEDIIKYSQQIIAYTSKTEYNIANGFFVRYNGYPYFLTANHAVAPDLMQLDKICFILHANATGLATRAIKVEKWQYIDLYKVPDDAGKFVFPCFDERIDFAFCSVNRENFKKSVVCLNHRLKDADDASCHNKSFECINLPQPNIQPSVDREYYVAGKILNPIGAVMWEYKPYFYSNMKYIGQCDGDKLYEFKVFQIATNAELEGLSGSPVFDKDKNLIGMAVRYRDYDNVLRVLPAEDIVSYLKNDCCPYEEYDNITNQL